MLAGKEPWLGGAVNMVRLGAGAFAIKSAGCSTENMGASKASGIDVFCLRLHTFVSNWAFIIWYNI